MDGARTIWPAVGREAEPLRLSELHRLSCWLATLEDVPPVLLGHPSTG